MEHWRTTPTPATACSPCCHRTKHTEVYPAVLPDYRAATFLCESSEHMVKTPLYKIRAFTFYYSSVKWMGTRHWNITLLSFLQAFSELFFFFFFSFLPLCWYSGTLNCSPVQLSEVLLHKWKSTFIEWMPFHIRLFTVYHSVATKLYDRLIASRGHRTYVLHCDVHMYLHYLTSVTQKGI